MPVYVADRYAGFEVKTFAELTEQELDRYIAANVEAVGDVEAACGGFGAALANHLVMGPLILARARLRFAAKVHGSALSYTVALNPRFLPYAGEGIAAAQAVLVGSRHTAAQLWETVGDAGGELEAKTRLGPPGVALDAFRPLGAGAGGGAALEALARRLEGATTTAAAADSFGRDPLETAAALRDYAAGEGPRVVFVGKLIVSKGCDLLLAAWPLVHARLPSARLLIAGFGAYREGLEQLWEAIGGGDLDRARRIAELGWGLEGGEPAPLRILAAFLDDPSEEWRRAAASAGGTVAFPGRLEHAEVGEVLAASDAMVVPSTFPEAFGMVAAEAAATGALPVCADHSGLAEVAAALDAGLPAAARGLTSFPLGPGAIEGIAERLLRWLELDRDGRAEAAAALRGTVDRLWSWEGVARSVIAASDGELDRLTPVPAAADGAEPAS